MRFIWLVLGIIGITLYLNSEIYGEIHDIKPRLIHYSAFHHKKKPAMVVHTSSQFQKLVASWQERKENQGVSDVWKSQMPQAESQTFRRGLPELSARHRSYTWMPKLVVAPLQQNIPSVHVNRLSKSKWLLGSLEKSKSNRRGRGSSSLRKGFIDFHWKRKPNGYLMRLQNKGLSKRTPKNTVRISLQNKQRYKRDVFDIRTTFSPIQPVTTMIAKANIDAPNLQFPIKRIFSYVGVGFRLDLPPDVFYDKIDGNSRNMHLELLTSHQKPIFSNSWIRFNQFTQQIYGFPLEGNNHLYIFHLKGTNSRGNYALNTIRVYVSSIPLIYNHDVTLCTSITLSAYARDAQLRIRLAEAIATYFFDTSVENVWIRKFQKGCLSITFRQLPTEDTCDFDAIDTINKKLFENGKVNPNLEKALRGITYIVGANFTDSAACTRHSKEDESPDLTWLKAVAPIVILLVIVAIPTGISCAVSREGRRRQALMRQMQDKKLREDEETILQQAAEYRRQCQLDDENDLEGCHSVPKWQSEDEEDPALFGRIAGAIIPTVLLDTVNRGTEILEMIGGSSLGAAAGAASKSMSVAASQLNPAQLLDIRNTVPGSQGNAICVSSEKSKKSLFKYKLKRMANLMRNPLEIELPATPSTSGSNDKQAHEAPKYYTQSQPSQANRSLLPRIRSMFRSEDTTKSMNGQEIALAGRPSIRSRLSSLFNNRLSFSSEGKVQDTSFISPQLCNGFVASSRFNESCKQDYGDLFDDEAVSLDGKDRLGGSENLKQSKRRFIASIISAGKQLVNEGRKLNLKTKMSFRKTDLTTNSDLDSTSSSRIHTARTFTPRDSCALESIDPLGCHVDNPMLDIQPQGSSYYGFEDKESLEVSIIDSEIRHSHLNYDPQVTSLYKNVSHHSNLSKAEICPINHIIADQCTRSPENSEANSAIMNGSDNNRDSPDFKTWVSIKPKPAAPSILPKSKLKPNLVSNLLRPSAEQTYDNAARLIRGNLLGKEDDRRQHINSTKRNRRLALLHYDPRTDSWYDSSPKAEDRCRSSMDDESSETDEETMYDPMATGEYLTDFSSRSQDLKFLKTMEEWQLSGYAWTPVIDEIIEDPETIAERTRTLPDESYCFQYPGTNLHSGVMEKKAKKELQWSPLLPVRDLTENSRRNLNVRDEDNKEFIAISYKGQSDTVKEENRHESEAGESKCMPQLSVSDEDRGYIQEEVCPDRRRRRKRGDAFFYVANKDVISLRREHDTLQQNSPQDFLPSPVHVIPRRKLSQNSVSIENSPKNSKGREHKRFFLERQRRVEICDTAEHLEESSSDMSSVSKIQHNPLSMIDEEYDREDAKTCVDKRNTNCSSQIVPDLVSRKSIDGTVQLSCTCVTELNSPQYVTYAKRGETGTSLPALESELPAVSTSHQEAFHKQGTEFPQLSNSISFRRHSTPSIESCGSYEKYYYDASDYSTPPEEDQSTGAGVRKESKRPYIGRGRAKECTSRIFQEMSPMLRRYSTNTMPSKGKVASDRKTKKLKESESSKTLFGKLGEGNFVQTLHFKLKKKETKMQDAQSPIFYQEDIEKVGVNKDSPLNVLKNRLNLFGAQIK